ncbi:hypothetical protein PAXRUDRAFT_22073 [Paxillus rubicundulus Ve08.2h10]|uniref:Uncharacterized protein n=1 Tax=Paxillus rubicundulus Ve08.2h10 TaxID=930991 RepID=A0A0D0BL33_9AGAM|nr:hypothetical protein PAXRUDRAFT_22073 [Paxillus rubicundulus Ve08.2h10]
MRAEAEAKARAEEVAQAQSLTSGPLKGKQLRVTASGTAEVTESNKCERPGDAQPSQQRKQEEVMSPRAGKKKVRTKSPTAEDDEEDAENRDVLGALVEVLSVMVDESV